MLGRHMDATQANTTITVSPPTVVSLRWGFNQYPNNTFPTSRGFNLGSLGFSQSLIESLQLPPSQQCFPPVSTSDLASYDGSGVSSTIYYSSSVSRTVAKFVGRHGLKMGGDYRAIHVAGTPTVTDGLYSFSSGFTNNENVTGPAILGTGSSLASMLLGFPSGGSSLTPAGLSNMIVIARCSCRTISG
jgi:hypothetical protein